MAERPTLSMQELSYYKLLKALKEQPFLESHAGIIANMARFLSSGPLLRYIIRHAPWYANWEVKAALLQNPATPARVKAELSRVFAVLDLMGEMDVPDITPEEKDELKADIRAITGGINEADRAHLKAYLKQRAVKTAKPAGETPAATASPEPAAPPVADILPLPPGIMMDDEAPDLGPEPEPEDDALAVEALLAGLSPEDQMEVAATTNDLPALSFLLKSPHAQIAWSVLKNPCLTLELLAEAIPEVVAPELLSSIVRTGRLYNDAGVRKALRGHEKLRAEMRETLEQGMQALELMEQMAAGGIPAFREHATTLSRLVKAVSDREMVWLETFAKERSPLLARSLATIAASRKAPAPQAPAAPAQPQAPAAPAQPQVQEVSAEDLGIAEVQPSMDDMSGMEMEAPIEDTPAPASFELADSSDAFSAVLNAQYADLEAIASLPKDKKLQLISQTQDRDVLALLLEDKDDDIFLAVLNNAALPEGLVASSVKRMSPHRLEMLTKHPTVWKWYRVRWEVLHSEDAPKEAQLEVVNAFTRIPELLHLLEDKKIVSVNVKSLAARKILEIYKPMSVQEKIDLIKQTDGKILGVLWKDAFQDDALMIELIRDRFLPRDVILKICASPMTTRKILYEIAQKEEWCQSSQVKLTLMQNPKIPQSVVAKLLPTLNPLDREKIIALRAEARGA